MESYLSNSIDVTNYINEGTFPEMMNIAKIIPVHNCRVVSDVTDLPEQAKNMHHLPVLLIFLHFRGWDVFIK